MNDKFLWVEKYAPTTIDECVLPTKLKEEFSQMTTIPNMLFIGNAGVGKTTVASVLCKTLNTDMMFMNASLENGIDDVRNKIQSFATTTALFGDYKVLLLDEADNLSPDAQKSLRALIEAHQNNCRFILTCNYAHKLIAPLRSRLQEYNFTYPSDGKQLKNVFVKRLLEILTREKVKIEKEDVPTLMSLVGLSYPNWRNCIHQLQRVTAKGTIDSNILSQIKEQHISTLFELLKAKNFKKMRDWVAENFAAGVAEQDIIRMVNNEAKNSMTPSSVPRAILIMAEYQQKAAVVANQEVNTVAMFTEMMLMEDIKWL
jgi:DNA polymerase III delta prime subunit